MHYSIIKNNSYDKVLQMSIVKIFIEKLLPNQQLGQIQVELMPNDYIFRSVDKDLMDALAKKIFENTERKPTVWAPIKSKSKSLEFYSMKVDKAFINTILPSFKSDDLAVELRKNNNIIDVDLSKPTQAISVGEFKAAYLKKYKSAFFKNPFSSMLKKLDTLHSMDEVENYVAKHPGRRSAEVLTELRMK